MSIIPRVMNIASQHGRLKFALVAKWPDLNLFFMDSFPFVCLFLRCSSIAGIWFHFLHPIYAKHD
ncbi:MAG: hypothetical protein ABSH48_22655 [Verrucomicrobiota bacterium]